MHRRLLVIGVALALVLAACGGGDDDGGTASPTTGPDVQGLPSTSSAPTDGSGTTGEGSDTTVGGATGSGTTKAGSTATTSGPTATTAGPAGTTTPPTAAPGATIPRPAVAGTYKYRQSGNSKLNNDPPTPAKAEGTLRVDAAGADGTQVFHRYVDPASQPLDTTFVFRADGIFIKTLVLRQQGFTFTCQFDPPVASPPWPPRVGATFSGTGDCGNFTMTVKGSITGTKQVTLDGAAVDTFVVETTLTTTGAVKSTTKMVDWFAPSLRLSAHNQTDTTGAALNQKFESHVTSDLISGKPA